MRRTIKGVTAAAALVVPVAVGWAYTAGASVGESGAGIAGFFSDETVDEFLVDDYLITREGHDGTVTMSVIGPGGAAVAPADLPADIAERLTYYESEWSPDDDSSFEVVDGIACYIVSSDMGPNNGIQHVEDTDSEVRIARSRDDADGNLTAQARQWSTDDLTAQQRDGLAAGDIEIADLPTGTDIPICAD